MCEEIVMTLCRQCGDIIRRKNKLIKINDFKSPCDICKQFGYDYKITAKGGEHNADNKARNVCAGAHKRKKPKRGI